jgi:hypothetical protein
VFVRGDCYNPIFTVSSTRDGETMHRDASVGLAGVAGETIIRYSDDRCLVPGCNGWFRAPGLGGSRHLAGAGGGMCHRHYRNLKRYGDPLGKKHLQRGRWLEAVHAYGDAVAADQGVARAAGDLIAATWDYHLACHAYAVRVREPSTEGVAALLSAAIGFTECDSEDGVAFEAARLVLDEAARSLCRSMAYYRNAWDNGTRIRKHPKKEAA